MTKTLHKIVLFTHHFISQTIPRPRILRKVIFLLLLAMLPLGYFESFRWPFPPPKATHGILKGLFLILSILVVAVPDIAKRKSEYFYIRLLLFLYLLSALFSTILSQSLDASFLFLWHIFIGVFVYLAFRKIKLRQNNFSVFVLIGILLLVITFSFALFSLIFRHSVENLYYFLFLEHRANHLLSEIRNVGKYVGLGPYFMLTPLCTVFLIDKKQPLGRKALSLVCLAVAALTSVITNNRIDVLVFVTQLFVILLLISRRLAVILLLLVIPFALFGMQLSTTYFNYNIADRILRPDEDRDIGTIVIRFSYWRTALYNFQNFPVFGTGLNTFNDISTLPLRRFYQPGPREYYLGPDKAIGVHNIFLERLSDTGLFGFLTFTVILSFFFREDMKRLVHIKRAPLKKRYILFALSSWSYILYGITDNGFGSQGLFMFFYLRGLMSHL